jgi:hypothetical protein
VNSTFQLQIAAIRSADIEEVELIILQQKTLLKNSKDVHEYVGCMLSLMAWNGCSGK